MNSCSNCANLLHRTESWEMPHIQWKECAVTNSHNLTSFPFQRTKCPHWKPEKKPRPGALDGLLLKA